MFKIDRLTRSTDDLVYLIDLFKECGCAFNSLMERIDTSTASGRMFIKIIGIFAEFEKANDQYNKRLDGLKNQFAALKLDNKAAEDLRQKLDNIENTIEAVVRLKEFSESVCGEILSKVVVEGRDKMSFYLTSGENKDPVFFKMSPSIVKY